MRVIKAWGRHVWGITMCKVWEIYIYVKYRT